MRSSIEASPTSYDLVLRGGTIIDGSADATPRTADLGIRSGRIVAIGNLVLAAADEVVDVAGRTVSPGFIDPHTHVEPALLDGRADIDAPLVQGVTTCLLGADGFGWAPLPRDGARRLWAAAAGINGPFPEDLPSRTVDDYLEGIEGALPFHVLPQVPHHAVRFLASGWSDGAHGATALKQMSHATAEWLAAGATGLAIGLDYEPGSRADASEIEVLSAMVGKAGGSLAAHLRYQDLGRERAWSEVVDIATRARVRLIVAHERLDDIGATNLERAQHAVETWVECYPYEAACTHLAIFLRRVDRSAGPVAIAERLRNPDARTRIAAHLDADLRSEVAAGRRFVVAATLDRRLIGTDLAVAAGDAGLSLGELAADLLRADPATLVVIHQDRPDARSTTMQTLAAPSTLIASDGLYVSGQVHPRGWGTFPRVLRAAIDGVRSGSLVDAVHAMTGRTARAYRVPNRGRLRPGAAADVVVFDPSTVCDRATWTSPRRAPMGIDHVLVNGTFAIRDGRRTGALAGTVLAAGAPA